MPSWQRDWFNPAVLAQEFCAAFGDRDAYAEPATGWRAT
jgi:hypothetical protein